MVSESTSVDNDGIVATVVNIYYISVMKRSSSVSNNNCIVGLLVMDIDEGVVAAMVNINKGIMRLLVLNKHGIVVLMMYINNGGLVMVVLNNDSVVRSEEVLSNNNGLSNWSDDGLNNDSWLYNRLDNWLVNGLLFNNDCVMAWTIDGLFMNLHIDNISWLDEELAC